MVVFLLARIRIYEDCCQKLDIACDSQIRALLSCDTIVITDRSLSFNGFRAFATAIEANLENLTLHSVGLTSRSINVLCQALNKCVRLNLLVKKNYLISLIGFSFISVVGSI